MAGRFDDVKENIRAAGYHHQDVAGDLVDEHALVVVLVSKENVQIVGRVIGADFGDDRVDGGVGIPVTESHCVAVRRGGEQLDRET